MAKEVIVDAKVVAISRYLDHVVFATLSTKEQEMKDISITKDAIKRVFDVDNTSRTILYKGTTTTVKIGDRVSIYLPSLNNNSVTNVILMDQEGDFDYPSLLKNANFSEKVQLGNSVFYVPPISIKVDKISTTKRMPTIRSKGSIKTQTGHTDTKITLTLFFPTIESINNPEDGLIALIAQFKRTPFVPVINYHLNYVHHIDAVCLQNLSVSTVPNFPKSLQAEVTLLAFEYMAYMPQEPSFINTIDADLFRWYYKRNLLEGEKRLAPMVRNESSVRFTYLPEEILGALKSKRQNTVNEGMTPGEKAAELYYSANTDIQSFKTGLENFEKAMRFERSKKSADNWHIYIPSYPSDFEIDFANKNGVGIGTFVKEGWLFVKLENKKNLGITDQRPAAYKPWAYHEKEGWACIKYDRQSGWSRNKEFLWNRLQDTLEREKISITNAQFDANIYSGTNVKKIMQEWPLDYSKIVVTDISVVHQNSFARLPLQQFERPAFQFIGTQDAYAKISMEVFGEETLGQLQRLYEYTQRVARDYRFDMVASHVGIKNELLQLFGIDFVLIDTITCSTIPNFPGRYYVEITMMDFDVCQKKREYSEVITNSGGNVVIRNNEQVKDFRGFTPGYVIFSSLKSPFDNEKSVDHALYWTKLENTFSRINLYPDLDLPTWEEVDRFLRSLKPARKLWFDYKETGGAFADPDFYFRPSTELKMITKDVLEHGTEMILYEADDNGKVKVDRLVGGESLSEKRQLSEKLEVMNLNKKKVDMSEADLVDTSDSKAKKERSDEKSWVSKAWDGIVTALSNFKVEPLESKIERLHRGGNATGNLFEREMIQMEVESSPKYKNRAFPVGVGPEGKYANAQWKDQWSDQRDYDHTGTMARAFPTAHVFLIDEGQRIGWFKLWDNFYGMNAICSLEVIKSRKIATETVYMTVSNVYRRYSDDNFKVKDVEFNLNRFFQLTIDDEMKRRHGVIKERMGLYPGARLHVRIGYGNNLANLPIVFNGVVTEVSTGEVVSVIAQNDALELTNILNYAKDKVAGNLEQGEEPSNMLVRLLVRGDKQGLSRMWSAIKSNLMFDDSHGVVHFGTPNFFLGTYTNAGEIGQNIYPGNGTGKTDFGILYNNEPNVHLIMNGKTIYDVAQLLSMYIPNYVTYVHPFEFRSTLFYGKPYWDLTYGYEVSDTKKEGFTEALAYHPFTQEGIELGYYIRPKKKPFQQWHLYSSFGHIIDNRIMASAEGMYHNCIVTIKEDKFLNLNHTQKESSVLARADQDIYNHIQKTTSVSSELYVKKPFALLGPISGIWNVYSKWLGTTELAQNLGMSVVRDYLKDMYQGDLVCLGDPAVKPYDGMYIADTFNEMFGAAFVKQVVHQFSMDTGFISLISPDAAVGIIEDDFADSILWAASVGVGSMVNWGLTCEAASSIRGKLLLNAANFIGSKPFLQTALAKTGSFLSKSAYQATLAFGSNVGTRAVNAFGMQVGSLQSGLASAGTAAGTATPPGWLALLATGAVVMTTKVLGNMIKNKLRESQCVVCSLLTVHGEEFSAGILGHQGITVGSMGGGKYGVSYWDRFIMGIPGWVKAVFNIKEIDLSPRMIFQGNVGDGINSLSFISGESTRYDEIFKQKVLSLTGTFETSNRAPRCYSVTVGNFDGMGISYGCLQWNLGQGTLQPILHTMFSRYPKIMESIFKNRTEELKRILSKSNKEQIAWADSISSKTKRGLIGPWDQYFWNLGRTSECQQIQLDRAESYFRQAEDLYREYGLMTERGFALMFDLVVQCGRIGSGTKELIMQDFAAIDPGLSITEQEVQKMRSITMRRAAATRLDPKSSDPTWIQKDVRNRKGCITFGKGTVHGLEVDLERDFGIGLRRLDL